MKQSLSTNQTEISIAAEASETSETIETIETSDAGATPDAGEWSALQRIGLSSAMQQTLQAAPPGAIAGPWLRVVEVQRDRVTLHNGHQPLAAQALPALLVALHDAADALAVGDWVQARPDAWGRWWVQHRAPPISQIARRLHDGRDKTQRVVIVSNVDCALLTMGLDLDFSLRRLERYHALARLAGVRSLVVLSKADLCAQTERRVDEVRSLFDGRVPVVALNGHDPASAATLAPWLGFGDTAVLLGSSGAGKSTLTNTLCGAALQTLGATRRGDGRGRHTTTARSLFVLPSGACIIDTPGLRTLRLDADEGELLRAFDDVAELAPQCRFRNCSHQTEPGCAVRAAVPEARLRNFHKLQREAQRDTQGALERQQQHAQWKARSRAARASLKAGRPV